MAGAGQFLLDRRFWQQIRNYQSTIVRFEAPDGVTKDDFGEEIPNWQVVPGLERIHCTFAPAGTFKDKERRERDHTQMQRVRLVLLDGVYANIQPPMRMFVLKPGHLGDPLSLIWKVTTIATDGVGVVTRLEVEAIKIGAL